MNIHKPRRNGLSYIERIVLDVITQRAMKGRPAPSHALLLDKLADRGNFVGEARISAAQLRLVELGKILIDTMARPHSFRRRFYVFDAECWTDWTDNTDRKNGAVTMRPCIVPSCGKTFASTGPGNRMCPTCRRDVETSPYDTSLQSSGYRIAARR